MMAETGDAATRAELVGVLRHTLSHLYDPEALRASPLARALGVAGQENTPTLLRRRLADKIEELRPESSTPAGSKAWRVYQILHYRYVEQLTQREVAADISISVRQLRRQEAMALRVLADSLLADWTPHRSARPPHSGLSLAGAEELSKPDRAPTRQQELDWLRTSAPSEQVSVAELLSSVVGTVGPLVDESGGQVRCEIPDDLPPVTVQPTTMRQAILNTLLAAIHRIPGGEINIAAETEAGQVHLSLRATGAEDLRSLAAGQAAEDLEMAAQLAEISGGTLELPAASETTGFFSARLDLPAVQQVSVLAVDDNRDTLRLLHRFLSGTRYRLTSTREPGAAIRLARQIEPEAILLDVMFPDFDGWELLGRLRENPQTTTIPVVVCTILPHDELARLLGAAEFVRKPFSRRQLLSTLDRLSDPSARECL
jgi:CheY-like chemotaxis protein